MIRRHVTLDDNLKYGVPRLILSNFAGAVELSAVQVEKIKIGQAEGHCVDRTDYSGEMFIERGNDTFICEYPLRFRIRMAISLEKFPEFTVKVSC